MTLQEIKDYITKNNKFGVDYIGLVGLSAGVQLAIAKNEGYANEVVNALYRFKDDDFGSFYSLGETPVRLHEYGCYDTSIGELFIHAESFHVVVYFQFER